MQDRTGEAKNGIMTYTAVTRLSNQHKQKNGGGGSLIFCRLASVFPPAFQPRTLVLNGLGVLVSSLEGVFIAHNLCYSMQINILHNTPILSGTARNYGFWC